MAEIVLISLLSNLDKSHTQCNVSSIYLEQTFVYGADVQLIFKNVMRNKKIYTKSGKILEADSAPDNRS